MQGNKMRRLRLTRLLITLLISVVLVNVSHAKSTYKCENSQGRVVDRVRGYILARCPDGVFIYKRRRKDKYQYMTCDADSGKTVPLTEGKFDFGECFVDGMAMVSPHFWRLRFHRQDW